MEIEFSTILYLRAKDKYLRIVTIKGAYMFRSSMRDMNNYLPKDLFCRIHRSYIVSLKHISWVTYNKVNIKGKNLPIGRQYGKYFIQKFMSISNHEKIFRAQISMSEERN